MATDWCEDMTWICIVFLIQPIKYNIKDIFGIKQFWILKYLLVHHAFIDDENKNLNFKSVKKEKNAVFD